MRNAIRAILLMSVVASTMPNFFMDLWGSFFGPSEDLGLIGPVPSPGPVVIN